MGCGYPSANDNKSMFKSNKAFQDYHTLLNANINTNPSLHHYTKEKKYFINSNLLVFHNRGIFEQNYTLEKQIGTGSYGKVYKCLHVQTKQFRAVKILKTSDFEKELMDKSNQDLVEVSLEKDEELNNLNKHNLRQAAEVPIEIKILSRLDHPNIICMFEYFLTTDNIYIVMELVEGVELFDYVSSKKYLSEEEAGYILKQVLSSLAYLHDNNIVHRDIKLENIIISPLDLVKSKPSNSNDLNKPSSSVSNNYTIKGKQFNYKVKIIDFGSSVFFNPKNTSKKNFLSKVCGSCYYLAPEVINSKYNEKCDVWSSGILFYVMISGGLPFVNKKEEEILEEIALRAKLPLTKEGLTRVVHFDTERWRRVSYDTKAFISQFLQSDREKRPTVYECLHNNWFDKHTLSLENLSLKLNVDSYVISLNKVFNISVFDDVKSIRIKNNKRNKAKEVNNVDSERNGLNKDIVQSSSNNNSTDTVTYPLLEFYIRILTDIVEYFKKHNNNNNYKEEEKNCNNKHQELKPVDINCDKRNNNNNPLNSKKNRTSIIFDILISIITKHSNTNLYSILKELSFLMFYIFDIDKNGKITFNEFTIMLREVKQLVEELNSNKGVSLINEEEVIKKIDSSIMNFFFEYNDILKRIIKSYNTNKKDSLSKGNTTSTNNTNTRNKDLIENILQKEFLSTQCTDNYFSLVKNKDFNLTYKDFYIFLIKILSNFNMINSNSIEGEETDKQNKYFISLRKKFLSLIFNDESLVLVFNIIDKDSKGYITKADILSLVEINTNNTDFMTRFGMRNNCNINSEDNKYECEIDFLNNEKMFEDSVEKNELDYLFNEDELRLFSINVYNVKLSEFKKYVYEVLLEGFIN